MGFLKKLFHKSEPQPITPPAMQKIPTATIKTERHYVAGISHYMDNIISLSTENPDYDMSERELLEEYDPDDRIYQYEFPAKKTELIEEPENEYDKNAIKVIIDGVHVGYIKKGSCSHIKKLLHSGIISGIDSEIRGGKYKYFEEDEEREGKYYLEKGTANYSIVIEIMYKVETN